MATHTQVSQHTRSNIHKQHWPYPQICQLHLYLVHQIITSWTFYQFTGAFLIPQPWIQILTTMRKTPENDSIIITSSVRTSTRHPWMMSWAATTGQLSFKFWTPHPWLTASSVYVPSLVEIEKGLQKFWQQQQEPDENIKFNPKFLTSYTKKFSKVDITIGLFINSLCP